MVSRGRMGGGLGAPKWGVAQKIGKTRQNGAYAANGGPPIPTYTPPPENRATAVLTPFPGISASAENPDSRSADETPTDYPYRGCPRFNPGPARWCRGQPAGAVGGRGRAQKPRTWRGLFKRHLSDYAGCIVLNASGIFRLSHSINRRVRSANPLQCHHHPHRARP